MSDSSKYEQPLFTETIKDKNKYTELKMSGKLWFLDEAPDELVGDV